MFSVPSDSSHLVDIFDSVRDLQDWKKFGLYLGVPYYALQKIELDEQGVDNCKMAMLYHWVCNCAATKERLAAALKKMGAKLQTREN